MSANPSALLRLWNEFEKVEPDALLSGIFAAKSGYHNTRANHLADRNGGDPDDYSVQSSLDKAGPSDKAAAIDITFKTAQRSDFRIISKYCKRMMNAMEDRDERLFYGGKPVVREFFGNTDLDRDVEGWSLYRDRSATSDSSHLWHMHISFHRWAVENWAAVSGVLAILLGQSSPYVAFPGASHFKLGAKSDTIGRMNTRLRHKDLGAPNSREFTATSQKAYASWQRKLGFTGADADGIPGEGSWDRLRVRKDTVIAGTQPKPAPEPAPEPAPAPAPHNETTEVTVTGTPAQCVRVEGEPAIYVVTFAGAKHIKNPTHLRLLRDAGMVTADEKHVTKAELAALLEVE